MKSFLENGKYAKPLITITPVNQVNPVNKVRGRTLIRKLDRLAALRRAVEEIDALIAFRLSPPRDE